jgi:hypothetical protein
VKKGKIRCEWRQNTGFADFQPVKMDLSQHSILSRETKHENRKHAFGFALGGPVGRDLDITRVGAIGGICGGPGKMSGSDQESISDRPRIRGD